MTEQSEGWVVTIFCAGQRRGESEPHHRLVEQVIVYPDRLERLPVGAPTTATTPGRPTDFRTTGEQIIGGRDRRDFRRRWDFACDRCTDHVPVRDDRLLAVLLGLREHGVSDVSLSMLRTALERVI